MQKGARLLVCCRDVLEISVCDVFADSFAGHSRSLVEYLAAHSHLVSDGDFAVKVLS